jgi:hypothetical protein
LALLLSVGGTASAATIFETGTFHGATGSISVTDDYVIWKIDLTDYYDDSAKDHSYLTDVGLKIEGITITSFDYTLGTAADQGWTNDPMNPDYPTHQFYAGGSIGGAGCTGSPDSGLSCLHIIKDLNALGGDSYSFYFKYTGEVVYGGDVSYRGKFGTGEGFVISESGSAVPEPTAAVVFGIGMLIVGSRSRRS